MTGQGSVPASVRLGLRENWRQFALLVLVNAFVGGMVGLERTVVPLIGSEEFKIASTTLVVSFIVSFGVVKALANLVSGHFADIYGRKHNAHPWLARRPANALHDRLGPELGQDRRRQCAARDQPRLRLVDDGHHESVDLVGPKSRGLAVGLNEFAGYISVCLTAFLNGYIAQHHGLRRQPFYIGKACAVLGLVCSPLLVQDTRRHVRLEMADHAALAEKGWFPGSLPPHLLRRQQPVRRLAGRPGQQSQRRHELGRFPAVLHGLRSRRRTDRVLKAIYPAVWGALQTVTGPLSDRWGRKGRIVAGMWVQAAGLFLTAATREFWWWFVASVPLGLGTAMVYPTLIASVSDASHPAWRARSLSVYRFWRDLGDAIGAFSAGVITDFFGAPVAIDAVGVLTLLSGAVVAFAMKEGRAFYRTVTS